MYKHTILRTLSVSIASVSLGAGIMPVGASAGSTVHVAGKAQCTSPIGGLNAKSVTISLDSGGETRSANTNWLGNYGLDFSRMPRGGTMATATVACSPFANHSSYTQRIFVKPDWRNHAEGTGLIG
jgi:hypothetical protein